MNKINIFATTTYARKHLTSDKYCRVHSVYRNTVNFWCDEQLLVLQGANSPLSPISLQCDLTAVELQSLNLHGGQSFTTDIFDLEHATVLDTKLSALDAALPVDNILAALKSVAAGNNFTSAKIKGETPSQYPLIDIMLNLSQDSSPHNFDMIFSFIDKKLRSALAEYRTGEYQQSARSLSSIIGAGIGLTPSSDDFLCGLLAGITLTEKVDSIFSTTLCREIANNLHRTNDISATFLRAALDGHFSQYICNIKPTSTAEQLITAFGKVGHSSGFDTLCGLYFTQVLCPCGTACSYPYSSCRNRIPVL